MSSFGFVKQRGARSLLAIVVAFVMALTAAAAGATAAASTTSPGSSAAAALPVAEKSKQKAKRNAPYAVPVTGTTSTGRQVAATFIPKRFAERRGELVAIGKLRGSISGTPRSFNRRVVMPVTDVNSTSVASSERVAAAALPGCDVLNLVLGPLDLNLLGLEVDLAEVVLDIVAQPGAGNLLGNLLCAVAGLLDGVALGSAIQGLLDVLADLLNRILGQLNA